MNVTFVTTMWDKVEAHMGAEKEKDLGEKFWKALIDQGAATARYYGTLESAWDIVRPFITRPQRQAILLQKEMVDQKKQLLQTSAGQALHVTPEVLREQKRDILQEIREAKRQESGQGSDPRIPKALQAEYDSIQQAIKGMQGRKPPLGKRLSRLFLTPIGFKSR